MTARVAFKLGAALALTASGAAGRLAFCTAVLTARVAFKLGAALALTASGAAGRFAFGAAAAAGSTPMLTAVLVAVWTVSTAGQKSHARQRQRLQWTRANFSTQNVAHWAVGTSRVKSERQDESSAILELPGGGGQKLHALQRQRPQCARANFSWQPS